MAEHHPEVEAFYRWLEETHPDVNLFPMQREWVEYALRYGRPGVWIGGRASGRTFISNLLAEFLNAPS